MAVRSGRWLRSGLAFGLSLAMALVVFQGCGDDDDDAEDDSADSGSGGGGSKVDVKTDCELVGSTCTKHEDCCTANCDLENGICAVPVGECKQAGDSCSTGNECCSVRCEQGTCSADRCTNDGEGCAGDGECCSGKCGDDALCAALNPNCKTSGNDCSGHGDCCSKFCNDGRCSSSPSFCVQNGDICSDNADCCGGVCRIADGARVGTCVRAAASGTPECATAGEVCGLGASYQGGALPTCGGECCSRACFPYGPTGVLVCQPPSGCRPTGELCRQDSDCCGAVGLPDGERSNVRCQKAEGNAVGRCDNGNACRAAGAICKLATSSCNAENNCCAGNVNTSPWVCTQDALGIPRCLPGKQDCTNPEDFVGKACASSADCCGLPCLPNKETGQGFVCGETCAPEGGVCTTSSDCCAGLPCVLEPGSSTGTCGEKDVPDSGPPPCALYGQDCTQDSDCCNGVPCTGGKCMFIPN
jgi:hypothetical protein